jgi:hypothetical protein
MNNKWILTVQEADDNSGDAIIEFTPEMLDQLRWEEGDTITWKDNEDGSFTLNKTEETEWVLVETLSQHKVSYMIEVPKGKIEYALDTVAMEDAKEFSQEHLRPTDIVINHRVVTKEEALALSDERNQYGASWDEETKIKNFFTTWKEQNNDYSI